MSYYGKFGFYSVYGGYKMIENGGYKIIENYDNDDDKFYWKINNLLIGKFNYHNKQDLAIIWTPKAACTIVNKMFFEEEGLLKNALKYNNWIHNFRDRYSQHPYVKKKKLVALSLKNKVTKWIQFTVNPYRRAVSSYIHCCKHPKACLEVDEYNNSFKQFLEDILNKKFYDNSHFCPQVFALYKDKNIEYLKLENINEILPYINKKYNLNYKLKDSSHHAKNTCILSENVTEFIGDRSWNELKENMPTNYIYFYNKEIRDLVEKIYNLDIKLFNYTWDEFIKSQESN